MVDLFDSTYRNFEDDVLARVRRATFGHDFGQNSWTDADEYRRWADWLELTGDAHVLEVACGAGGPALFLAGLGRGRVTGIDVNAHGIATAARLAAASPFADRVAFEVGDATARLPFTDASFTAIVCVDSACHFPRRLDVLREWRRVLRPGGRLLFTDPVVVTGFVGNDELAVRSSIGFFLFSPPGVNETLLAEVGFTLERREDVTANAAAISQRWHDARERDREALLRIEGDERFAGLQRFFTTVHRLTSERRLSRFAYLARR
jgi:SAM-dependent methyltransferase